VSVKLLLRKDVAGLGRRGELVEVAEGYARNYLVPKGLAMKATPGAEAQAESMRKARIQRDAATRAEAEEVATRLVPMVFTTSARAGSGGRLFGSVGPVEVAELVARQAGVSLDRRIIAGEPAKTVGTHVFMVRLHHEVEFPVTVEVSAG
jgi:large subunit ribosomal protein L9